MSLFVVIEYVMVSCVCQLLSNVDQPCCMRKLVHRYKAKREGKVQVGHGHS